MYAIRSGPGDNNQEEEMHIALGFSTSDQNEGISIIPLVELPDMLF